MRLMSVSRATVPISRLFVDERVQRLLVRLTSTPKFSKRRAESGTRSHYALMSEEMIEKIRHRVEDKARYYQQFVPVMEPRSSETAVLAVDPDIRGYDLSKFVFTDITFDTTNRERLVVVREPDGTLRMASVEEHDRMNRIFYPQADRPVEEPALFSDPDLESALRGDQHEFILDWACYYFEPDSPRYIEVSQRVYSDALHNKKLDLLQHTRHFGPLIFHACLEKESDKVDKLVEHFGVEEGKRVVALQQLLSSPSALIAA